MAELGLVPAWVWRWLAILAVGASLFGFGYVRGHSAEEVKFNAFVAQVKAEGEDQQALAKKTIAANQAKKDKADADYKARIAALGADAQRMRDERARAGFLPPATPGASHPERACFDRALLQRALEQLDAGAAGIAEEGDGQRVGLDTAKAWAQQP